MKGREILVGSVDFLKYKIGDIFKIKEDLKYDSNVGIVNPIEYHFRGYKVEVVKRYPLERGYGVTFGETSREFFVHTSHIEEE